METPSPAAELDTEADTMRALRTLLEREQACLSAGDADGCAALLEDKAVLVAAMAEHAHLRHQRLAAAGFPANEQGMQHWLATAPQAACTDWEALMTITRDAHELNRINGMLLGQLATRNRRALEALGAIGSGPALYGPAGQADYAAPRTARVVG
jgi:flagellar biosynthesis protein FlgN